MLNKEHIFPQVFLRSWPFPRGSGFLAYWLFRNLSFAEKLATVRTTDDFQITVMPNDLIGRHIYLTGEFDRSNVEVLCNFAEPGDTLLDIGANVGYVTACFLTKVPNSRAVSVEPQPEVLDLLRKNLTPFDGRAVVYPYALSQQDGVSLLSIDPNNRGIAHISESGTVSIETRKVGTMLSELAIDKIDLVKIDVEGHEEQIFSAGIEHFARLQPKVILFEEHSDKSAGSIGNMLRDAGYEIYSLRKKLTRLDFVTVRSAADCKSNDYVAVSTKRRLPTTATSLYL
jgi:FkbM family methyltransferase